MISLPLLVYVYLSYCTSFPLSVFFSPSFLPLFLNSQPLHLYHASALLCLARGRAYLMDVSVDFFSTPSSPILRFIPLWPASSPLSLCTPTLSLFLHSSVLNALPLSTLESERSSLLWRRRGIWIRSTIRGLRLLFS